MRYKFEGFAKGRESLINRFLKAGFYPKKYIEDLDYCIENSQIFVVDEFPGNYREVFNKTKKEFTDALTNLPFNVCCFEPLGHSWCVGKQEEDTIIDAVIVGADKNRNELYWALKSDGVVIPINDESLNGDYDNDDSNISQRSAHVLAIIVAILDKINSNEFSEGKINHRKKIKYKKNTNRRIGDVIYLTNKNPKKRSESLNHIDFTHRFLRRGHWRKLNAHQIGKNRDGNRSEQGRTWVNHCEVGASDLPIIKKTRWIK